jgi:hypothetical protein
VAATVRCSSRASQISASPRWCRRRVAQAPRGRLPGSGEPVTSSARRSRYCLPSTGCGCASCRPIPGTRSCRFLRCEGGARRGGRRLSAASALRARPGAHLPHRSDGRPSSQAHTGRATVLLAAVYWAAVCSACRCPRGTSRMSARPPMVGAYPDRTRAIPCKMRAHTGQFLVGEKARE